MVLEILFLTFNNANIQFAKKKAYVEDLNRY